MDKKYTLEQVIEASKEYFGGDDLAASAFANKYALSDNDGNYLELTPEDMHHRLAKEFARIEKKYPNPLSEEKIFELFDHFKYIVPHGSPMSAVGNSYQTMSCSNCFCLEPPYDSYAGILKTDQEQAHIYKRRGGAGFDISNIRPRGVSTNNAAKTTDGISVFMERFSNTTREVAMQGRRGALLLSISCNHPEILTFIKIKNDHKKVTGANISIKVTDEFLNAVINNSEFELKWPVDSDNPKVTKKVMAKDIWNDIMNSVHRSGDPGILLIDNILKYTPAEVYKDFGFHHTSTNPCGELVLNSGPDTVGSCILISINLFSYVTNPFTQNAKFDYSLFSEHVVYAQRLIDDLVDLEIESVDRIIKKIENDPEPEFIKSIELNLWKNVKRTCVMGRRTGLGITALADVLAALNIRYGSNESLSVVEEIYKTLAINSYKSSCIMAGERGPFEIFSHKLEKNHPFLERIWEASPEVYKLYKKYGRRNISNTTTAPTGTVSLLTQTSSGIEPVFLLEMTRRKKVNSSDKSIVPDFIDESGDAWKEYPVSHHGFSMWRQISGKNNIEESPYYKATAMDFDYKSPDWKNHIKIQALAQKWICHSISKTLNVPTDTPVNVIGEAYLEAWRSGCKGFTVFRDKCKQGVLVNTKENYRSLRPTKIEHISAPKRPTELICDIQFATVNGVKWIIMIGLFDNMPYEIFMGQADKLNLSPKIKEGKIIKVKQQIYNLLSLNNEILVEDIIKTADNNQLAWITRMMSMALRHGIPVEYIVDQLSKEGSIVDINNVLARLLRKFIKSRVESKEKCPQCGGTDTITYEENCKKCSCGWGKCG